MRVHAGNTEVVDAVVRGFGLYLAPCREAWTSDKPSCVRLRGRLGDILEIEKLCSSFTLEIDPNL